MKKLRNTPNLIISIDQGTTGTTALLMNTKGHVLGSVNVPFKQIFPKAGWVEHDPNDILKSTQKAIKKVLETTKSEAKNILTVGVTNQRETIVFWDGDTGEPIGNAIVWQCRRTTKRTEQIKKNGDESWIKKKTGLGVDPYFSSTKIEWFLKNQISSQQKKTLNLKVGTVDSFLIWTLSGGESFYTEPSNASRTQLFGLKNQKWDEDLLKYFKIKESYLPEVIPSNGEFGVVKNFKPLISGTPITGVLGDQQSALFGQRALNSGDAKCTFGTGSFVLLNTGAQIVQSKSGLLSTVAWSLKGQKTIYALEGGAFNCGSCINWFMQELGVVKKASDIGALASKVESSLGVKFAPTFSGMGAPYWSPESRGAFVGLSLGARGEHMARALLEGLSFQNTLIFEAMEKDLESSKVSNFKMKKVYVDGGAAQSNFFMEQQALFSGKRLLRPKNIETTAVGAALMAGVGSGVFSANEKTINPVESEFKVKAKKTDRDLIEAYRLLFKSLQKKVFF